MKEDTKELNLSVIKAFKLLEAFTSGQQEWGVRELAKEAGYNKTTTYRLLSTLETLGAVQKNKADKYILGLKLFELGNLVSIHKSLRYISRVPLEQIAKEINETIHFGVLNDNKVLYLNKAESLQGLKVSTQIGSYQSAYCSAIGKVLLAYLPEDALKNYFEEEPLSSYTVNTITSEKVLRCELEKVREEGYALDMEELELGLICIAIPVFNRQNKIVASISASGPSSRFKTENVSAYLDILLKGSREIEAKLNDYN